MKKRFFLTLCLAGAALPACSAPKETGVIAGTPGNPTISISEGACNDTCPVYSMTLHPDGSYALLGARFVKSEGLSEGNIGPEAYEAAQRVLERADFWKMKQIQTPETVSPCQDGGPEVLVTWRMDDGKEKTVTYNGGCEMHETRGMVAALRIALRFDDLVWTNRKFEFIPKPPED